LVWTGYTTICTVTTAKVAYSLASEVERAVFLFLIPGGERDNLESSLCPFTPLYIHSSPASYGFHKSRGRVDSRKPVDGFVPAIEFETTLTTTTLNKSTSLGATPTHNDPTYHNGTINIHSLPSSTPSYTHITLLPTIRTTQISPLLLNDLHSSSRHSRPKRSLISVQDEYNLPNPNTKDSTNTRHTC
jgi:hypothetical protein